MGGPQGRPLGRLPESPPEPGPPRAGATYTVTWTPGWGKMVGLKIKRTKTKKVMQRGEK